MLVYRFGYSSCGFWSQLTETNQILVKENGLVNWYFLNHGNVQTSRLHFSPFLGPIFSVLLSFFIKSFLAQ